MKFADTIAELRKGIIPKRALPQESSEYTWILEHYFPRRLHDTGSRAQTRLVCRYCKEPSGHRLEDENTFSWHEAYFHFKVDCKEMKKNVPSADIKLFLAAICQADKPDFFYHTIRSALRPPDKRSPSINAFEYVMSENDFRIVRGWDSQKGLQVSIQKRSAKAEHQEVDDPNIEHKFVAPTRSRWRHPSEAEALLQLSHSAIDDDYKSGMKIDGLCLEDSPVIDSEHPGTDTYIGDPSYVSSGLAQEDPDLLLPDAL